MVSQPRVSTVQIDWSLSNYKCIQISAGNKYLAAVYKSNGDFDSYHVTYGYNLWG